jgi:hypothetical protein
LDIKELLSFLYYFFFFFLFLLKPVANPFLTRTPLCGFNQNGVTVKNKKIMVGALFHFLGQLENSSGSSFTIIGAKIIRK